MIIGGDVMNGGIIFSKMVRTADPDNGYVDIG
ncbi:hypothetical protein L244_37360 [Salmonella enterica subsp. enterica serovar Worthington str. BCH-3194]|nr:hypothetical protein L244_37360 [Salmonella enterica subsp. enterica serovar Worthington str. BCH-3194]